MFFSSDANQSGHIEYYVTMPLPSINTLNNRMKSLHPEFGFDKALFAVLAVKLACLPCNECCEVLMFDKIQNSKNVDF